jgi:hypothetical protein
MRKLNSLVLTLLSLVIISGIVFSGVSYASPVATKKNSTIHAPNGSIPKASLRKARTEAEAEVLGISQQQIFNLMASKTFVKFLSADGLTPKTFREDVRSQMYSDLLTAGFSDHQITTSLDSRYIRNH